MKDIVFPQQNEQEFVAMAKKLGYTELVFAYETPEQFYTKPASIKISNAVVCDPKKVERYRKKASLMLVKHTGQDRYVLEKTKADILFGVEATTERDKTHQRSSGLNHIMCKIAERNKKKIAFDFNMILTAKSKARLLGRMKQNIKLCRKYKVQTVIASFAQDPLDMRSPQDLQSFFVVLGMHPAEAKKSLNW